MRVQIREGSQLIMQTPALAGGTSTASAKFAALNMMGSGTPTASVSSGLNGTSMSIDANGNITTANKMTLTLGGGSTGNILISPNVSTTISGTTILSAFGSAGIIHNAAGDVL